MTMWHHITVRISEVTADQFQVCVGSECGQTGSLSDGVDTAKC